MSDPKDDKPEAPKGDNTRAPLSLKPRVGGNVSTGTVKQSFSHGRSKTVVVETKRRIGTPPQGAPSGGAQGTSGAPRSGGENLARPRPAAPQGSPSAPRPAPSGGNSGGLRQDELERRARVLEQARVDQERREAEARRQAEQRAREEAARRAAAAEATPKSEAPAPAAAPS